MNVSEIKDVMTKEQLLKKVCNYEAAEPIEVELGRQVRFSTGNEGQEDDIVMTHNRGTTTLSPVALGTLVANIGFPRPYLKKVPKEEYPSLLLPHLNYWYQNALAGGRIRLLNIENRTIMVVPKADFEHVKISDVITATERQLGKNLVAGYHKLRITPEAFCFSIITSKEVELKKGDLFNAGIRVNHSLTGATSTSLSAYLFRQWCSNGATTEDKLETWHRRNSSDDLETWLQKSIIGANQAFDKETKRVEALLQIPTDGHTAEVLNSVLDQSSVPQGLQREVRSTLLDRDPETLYDIYNALTEIDTHSDYFEDHPGSIGTLNRVATHLTHNSKLCPTCHKQI